MKPAILLYDKIEDNHYSLIGKDPNNLIEADLEGMLYRGIVEAKSFGESTRAEFKNRAKFSRREKMLIADSVEGRGYRNMGMNDDHKFITHSFRQEGDKLYLSNYDGMNQEFDNVVDFLYGLITDIIKTSRKYSKKNDDMLPIRVEAKGEVNEAIKELAKCTAMGREQRIYRQGKKEDRRESVKLNP